MKTTMAEGGGGRNDGNPFSFKKFVKDQTGKESDNEDNIAEEIVLPGVSNAQAMKTLWNQQERQQSQCDVTCKKSRGEDNPFSFKKFLQTEENDGDARHNIATLDLANDLPDFVQNQQTFSTHYPTRQTRSDHQLPDFTLDLQTTRNHSHRRTSLNTTSEDESQVDKYLPDFTSVLNVDSGSEDNVPSEQCRVVDTSQCGAQLPDFTLGLDPVQPSRRVLTGDPPNHPPEVQLPDFAVKLPGCCTSSHGTVGVNMSDPVEEHSGYVHEHCPTEVQGAMSGQSGRPLPDFLSDYTVSLAAVRQSTLTEEEDQVDIERNDITRLEFTKLQAENTQLRQQLTEEREKVGRQATRLTEALNEIKVIQKREMEETNVLENMVQQVETNLIRATTRAINAETNVLRREEEIASLQRKVQALEFENDTLNAGGNPKDHIKEQVRSASRQLSTAADQAEITLQQLLTGVQTIKLVSTSLASIGKMAEVNLGQFEDVDDITECGASGYGGH